MDKLVDLTKRFAPAFTDTPHGYIHFMLARAIDQLGRRRPLKGYSVELWPQENEQVTEVSFNFTAVFDVSGEFAGHDMRGEHEELVSWLRALGFIVSGDEAGNPDIMRDRIRVVASMQVPKRESDHG